MVRSHVRPAPGLSVLAALAALVVAAGPAAAQEPIRVADEVVEAIETPHPYPGGGPAREAVWSHVLRWPRASFIAVHFARFELAPGDELVLSDPQGTVRHRYTGRGLRDRGGDFWGLSVFGDTMVITLYSRTQNAGGAYGVLIDRWTHGFPVDERPPETEALCGAEDFRDIECYRDSEPQAFDKGRAVVRLLKNGSAHCTGWLASCENHIITNEHCVGSQSELNQIEFQFEYKRPACGSGTASAELQLQGGTLLEVDPGLDYALIMPELAGNDPQATYGYMQLETRLPDIGELMYIPGHPSGDPKRLSIESTDSHDPTGRCEVHSTDEPACTGGPVPDVGYYCDTEGGSSGSPVLSYETHRVIALHHCANCPNRGVPIVDVYNDIQASAHPLPPCSTCIPAGTPQDLVASTPGDNRIFLDWQPVADATLYHVYRSTISCDEGMGEIGTSTEPSYLDDTVGGGITYFYRVTAESACGAQSGFSNCAQQTPTGECIEAPRFDGVASVSSSNTGECGLDLSWSPATARCGTARYNVYRSTFPDFEPGPGNLVASCLTTTSWHDADVLSRTTYWYVVRAEDDSETGGGPCSGGNEETNLVVRGDAARGPDALIYRADFDGASFGWNLGNEWQIGVPQGKGGADGGGQGGPDPTGTPFGPGGALGLDISGQGAFPGNYENNETTFALSPPVDTRGHDEVYLRFWRWLSVNAGPGDRATLEVCRDGVDCREVWASPDGVAVRDDAWTLFEVDVTDDLLETADARVRFGLSSDASGVAAGWTVDRVDLYDRTACSSPAAGVPPVPDGGRAPGAPMRAVRGAGEQVELTWDTSRCASAGYHLAYGDETGLATGATLGARCGLGTAGTASVAIPDPPPGSLTWWTLAGDDGAVEGPHGYDSAGGLRAVSAVGSCGLTAQSTAGICR
ncbi:MAG: hypothetical protein Kow0062_01930 [Acidobacteriota bacterium]